MSGRLGPLGRTLAAAFGSVLVLLLPAAVLLVAVTSTGTGDATTCAPAGSSGQTFDDEQLDIAHTIVTVVEQRALPRRAAVLAVATALVESGLHNLPSGDRDSLGVFQQRPSQGWGTAAQILNPAFTTGKFLDALITVPGWQSLPPGEAEQSVQRSAFPDRYAPRESEADTIVASYWNGSDTGSASVSTTCGDTGAPNLPLGSGRKPTDVPPGFTLPTDPRQAVAVGYALQQLGKPYVWGAKGPKAFDCSGLTLAAWAAAGVALSAGTINQVHDGLPVATLAELQPGDLLFIPGSLGTAQHPRHVGLYAGHGLIVDAYDTNTGVILEPLDAWAHQVAAIRRVAPATTVDGHAS